MPLSEDEQKILTQIEQQLYEDDPGLAHEVSSTTVFSHGFKHIRLAALGFVVGLTVLLATLSTSYWLSFVGFLIMLSSAWYGEKNLRRVGRAGLQQVTGTARGSSGRGFFGDASQRMRDRLNDSDEEK
ncbi:MAG: hypothetical protein ACI81L_003590 [Verrucomicrobiales bacterium]|jgi:hypothetical protein